MELRFALIYDNTKLDINEPVGFDAFEPELERNDMHGVSAEYSDIDLEFTDCDAIDVIKGKYELSLDSVIEFVVEMWCGNGNDIKEFNEIYRGQLDLSTYQFLMKEYTSVKCKVGQVGVFTTFNNRLDTDVCLDELTSLDGSALAAYDFMNYEVEVPGKMVISRSSSDDIGIENDYYPLAFDFLNGNIAIIYVPGMLNAKDGDLGHFISFTPYALGAGNKIEPFFELNKNEIETPRSDINFYITLILRIDSEESGILLDNTFENNAIIEIYNEFNHVLYQAAISDTLRPKPTGLYDDFEFFASGNFSNVVFKKIFLRIIFRANISASLTEHALRKLHLSVLPGSSSYFNITTYSILPPTKVKTFLLHEALSRISESITDNGLQVYSDYYGRPDNGKAGAQKLLNEVPSDGLGALRCLTNGYKLRKHIYTDGSAARMYLSMKKAVNSLSAIDNIGVGFSFEMGKWCVRVENWKWFYSDVKLFEIKNPSNVERKLNSDEVNTRLHVGYKKYAELSESNVVDTFHSERNYSTLLKAVDRKVSAVSEFVADAYAIEYTRRKSIEKDTKDWSYDEDVFILCLMGVNVVDKRIGSGEIINTEFKYAVDNGMVDAGNSIISPETMLNVHVSPARNAERWADRMSQYPGALGMKYLSGTRNTNAAGRALIRQNPTITTIGAIERTINYRQKFDIAVSENADVALSNPHLKAETLEFDYPITLSEFNAIRLDPYGYILVDGEKCYLKSVKYNFKTSLAKLVLIPTAL